MPLPTPHVPDGLIDLMKDLTKEVLREKPESIYEFAANYFDKLLQKRDGSLNKNYEQFALSEEAFRGKQLFEIPSNIGFVCAKATSKLAKSKSSLTGNFKAMGSINEEEIPSEDQPYPDEKYEKAIYIIQRYYRRYAANKKIKAKSSSPVRLTATAAALIIQRTMRILFSNKIKLKKDNSNGDGNKLSGTIYNDDVDNVSEAASYTSSSTIQMLADSQDGRENRLLERDVISNTVADNGSTGLKEQITMAQGGPTSPLPSPQQAIAAGNNAEVLPTAPLAPNPETAPETKPVVETEVGAAETTITTKAELNKKSMADENGNIPHTTDSKATADHPVVNTFDETNTTPIGISPTIIGSNDHQNSQHSNVTAAIATNPRKVSLAAPVTSDVEADIDLPHNIPQSHGVTPATIPSSSPLHDIQETFPNCMQGNTYAGNLSGYTPQIKKMNSDIRETLGIYDIFYQDRDDPEYPDSLNESVMERDSLDNEDLDIDSLESSETMSHLGSMMKRELKQDDGSLYEESGEIGYEVEKDTHKLIELERVPTYLYGIHPTRTPVAERKNLRSKGSADNRKIQRKDISSVENKEAEDKSEENSIGSKESTSDESHTTQIENVLDLNNEAGLDQTTMSEGRRKSSDFGSQGKDIEDMEKQNDDTKSRKLGSSETENLIAHAVSTNATDKLLIDEKSKEVENDGISSETNLGIHESTTKIKPIDSNQQQEALLKGKLSTDSASQVTEVNEFMPKDMSLQEEPSTKTEKLELSEIKTHSVDIPVEGNALREDSAAVNLSPLKNEEKDSKLDAKEQFQREHNSGVTRENGENVHEIDELGTHNSRDGASTSPIETNPSKENVHHTSHLDLSSTELNNDESLLVPKSGEKMISKNISSDSIGQEHSSSKEIQDAFLSGGQTTSETKKTGGSHEIASENDESLGNSNNIVKPSETISESMKIDIDTISPSISSELDHLKTSETSKADHHLSQDSSQESEETTQSQPISLEHVTGNNLGKDQLRLKRSLDVQIQAKNDDENRVIDSSERIAKGSGTNALVHHDNRKPQLHEDNKNYIEHDNMVNQMTPSPMKITKTAKSDTSCDQNREALSTNKDRVQSGKIAPGNSVSLESETEKSDANRGISTEHFAEVPTSKIVSNEHSPEYTDDISNKVDDDTKRKKDNDSTQKFLENEIKAILSHPDLKQPKGVTKVENNLEIKATMPGKVLKKRDTAKVDGSIAKPEFDMEHSPLEQIDDQQSDSNTNSDAKTENQGKPEEFLDNDQRKVKINGHVDVDKKYEKHNNAAENLTECLQSKPADEGKLVKSHDKDTDGMKSDPNRMGGEKSYKVDVKEEPKLELKSTNSESTLVGVRLNPSADIEYKNDDRHIRSSIENEVLTNESDKKLDENIPSSLLHNDDDKHSEKKGQAKLSEVIGSHESPENILNVHFLPESNQSNPPSEEDAKTDHRVQLEPNAAAASSVQSSDSKEDKSNVIEPNQSGIDLQNEEDEKVSSAKDKVLENMIMSSSKEKTQSNGPTNVGTDNIAQVLESDLSVNDNVQTTSLDNMLERDANLREANKSSETISGDGEKSDNTPSVPFPQEGITSTPPSDEDGKSDTKLPERVEGREPHSDLASLAVSSVQSRDVEGYNDKRISNIMEPNESLNTSVTQQNEKDEKVSSAIDKALENLAMSSSKEDTDNIAQVSESDLSTNDNVQTPSLDNMVESDAKLREANKSSEVISGDGGENDNIPSVPFTQEGTASSDEDGKSDTNLPERVKDHETHFGLKSVDVSSVQSRDIKDNNDKRDSNMIEKTQSNGPTNVGTGNIAQVSESDLSANDNVQTTSLDNMLESDTKLREANKSSEIISGDGGENDNIRSVPFTQKGITSTPPSDKDGKSDTNLPERVKDHETHFGLKSVDVSSVQSRDIKDNNDKRNSNMNEPNESVNTSVTQQNEKDENVSSAIDKALENLVMSSSKEKTQSNGPTNVGTGNIAQVSESDLSANDNVQTTSLDNMLESDTKLREANKSSEIISGDGGENDNIRSVPFTQKGITSTPPSDKDGKSDTNLPERVKDHETHSGLKSVDVSSVQTSDIKDNNDKRDSNMNEPNESVNTSITQQLENGDKEPSIKEKSDENGKMSPSQEETQASPSTNVEIENTAQVLERDVSVNNNVQATSLNSVLESNAKSDEATKSYVLGAHFPQKRIKSTLPSGLKLNDNDTKDSNMMKSNESDNDLMNDSEDKIPFLTAKSVENMKIYRSQEDAQSAPSNTIENEAKVQGLKNNIPATSPNHMLESDAKLSEINKSHEIISGGQEEKDNILDTHSSQEAIQSRSSINVGNRTDSKKRIIVNEVLKNDQLGNQSTQSSGEKDYNRETDFHILEPNDSKSAINIPQIENGQINSSQEYMTPPSAVGKESTLHVAIADLSPKVENMQTKVNSQTNAKTLSTENNVQATPLDNDMKREAQRDYSDIIANPDQDRTTSNDELKTAETLKTDSRNESESRPDDLFGSTITSMNQINKLSALEVLETEIRSNDGKPLEGNNKLSRVIEESNLPNVENIEVNIIQLKENLDAASNETEETSLTDVLEKYKNSSENVKHEQSREKIDSNEIKMTNHKTATNLKLTNSSSIIDFKGPNDNNNDKDLEVPSFDFAHAKSTLDTVRILKGISVDPNEFTSENDSQNEDNNQKQKVEENPQDTGEPLEKSKLEINTNVHDSENGPKSENNTPMDNNEDEHREQGPSAIQTSQNTSDKLQGNDLGPDKNGTDDNLSSLNERDLTEQLEHSRYSGPKPEAGTEPSEEYDRQSDKVAAIEIELQREFKVESKPSKAEEQRTETEKNEMTTEELQACNHFEDMTKSTKRDAEKVNEISTERNEVDIEVSYSDNGNSLGKIASDGILSDVATSTGIKKADRESSVDQPTPTEVIIDGESGATSADFSSIDKDIGFYKNTVNYLRDATLQLGAQINKEIQDENKNDLTKDATSQAADDLISQAATTIQSAYKGYRVRKNLQPQSRATVLSSKLKAIENRETLATGIPREEQPDIQTFKVENPDQTSYKPIDPRQKNKIVRAISLNETKDTSPRNLNKTNIFKKGQSVGSLSIDLRPQIKPDKSIRHTPKSKHEATTQLVLENSVSTNEDNRKESDKARAKGIRSKLPSASKSAVRKRFENPKKFRKAISMNEKSQKVPAFDIDAIKKDLLSKNVNIPSSSGTKSKTKGPESSRRGSSKNQKNYKPPKSTEVLDKAQDNDRDTNESKPRAEKGEEDILKNLAEQSSAIVIQKTFRGYKTRKNLPKYQRNSLKEVTTSPQNKKVLQIASQTLKSHELKSTTKSEKDPEYMSEGKETQSVADEIRGTSKPMVSNQDLNQAATIVQKAFKGYKNRKDILNRSQVEGPTLNSLDLGQPGSPTGIPELNGTFRVEHPTDNYTEDTTEGNHKLNETFRVERPSQSVTSSFEDSNEAVEELTQNQAKTNSFDNSTPFLDSTSEQISSIASDQIESNIQLYEPERTLKTTSANALLENAASTIQKAYRNYNSRKRSRSLTTSIRRFSQDIIPIETSDGSSTFIGPDTSFDLSDVDSVEPKTDQQTPTPPKDNNSEPATPPTFSVHLYSRDQGQDNDSISTPGNTGTTTLSPPQTIRRNRNIAEPTAPPLDEILQVNDPKPQWYVGDELIVPTDDTNSTSLLEPLASSSSFDNLDARTEILNSIQQPITPDNSAVVTSSSSSLLNAIDTDALGNQDSQKLNKSFGAVSAQEEKKEKQGTQEGQERKEGKNEDDKKEEQENKPKATKEDPFDEKEDNKDNEKNESVAQDGREGNFVLDIDDPFSVKNSIKDENKQEEVVSQELDLELCEKCASGIHEHAAENSTEHKLKDDDLQVEADKKATNAGGSSDSSRETHFDEIKHFVLMEMGSRPDENDSARQEQAKGIDSNGNEQANDTDISIVNNKHETGAMSVKVVGGEVDNYFQDRVESSIAVSGALLSALIPPSSEDDTSERASGPKALEREDDLKSGDAVQTSDGRVDTNDILESAKRSIEQEQLSKDTEIESNEEKDKKQVGLVAKDAKGLDPSVEHYQTDNKEIELYSIDMDEIETEVVKKGYTQQHEGAIGLPSEQNKDPNKENEQTEKQQKTNRVVEATPEQEKTNLTEEQNRKRNELETVGPLEGQPEEHNEIRSSDEVKDKTPVGKEKADDAETTDDIKSENKDEPRPEKNDQPNDDSLEASKTHTTAPQKDELQGTVDQENSEIPIKDLESEENIKTESLEEFEIASKLTNIYKSELETENHLSTGGTKQDSIQMEIGELIEETNFPPDSKQSMVVNLEQKEDEKAKQNEELIPNVQQKDTTEAIQETNENSKAEGKVGISRNDSSSNQEIVPLNSEGHIKSEQDQLGNGRNLKDNPLIADSTIKEQEQNTETNKMSLETKDPQEPVDQKETSLSEKTPELLNKPESDVQTNVEALIEGSAFITEAKDHSIHIPTHSLSHEVIEEPCTKKILPKPINSIPSDQEESEIESTTTTKGDSTTSTPGYDEASENDVPRTPPSKPDHLETMAEKLSEPEATVARMQKRHASEQKTSIDNTDPPAAFGDSISEPIRPMQELQKSISSDVDDDLIFQTLQRGETTRESSAQSESVIFGDSTSQQTESEDTFNEHFDFSTLHRMNTIAAERSTYKPQNLLLKSVTIDDTIKYIDADKSTGESGGSLNFDDTTTAHVRNKMMAYSVSEADSDYFYGSNDHSNHARDDFNISTALDTFPSTDTDTTIISAAATKIQAGARGFLTRRRIRRASMGTKSSLSETRTTSFGNDAIGHSLEQLVEVENGKRMPKTQYHRQVGVNSLPSALDMASGTEDSSSTRVIIQSIDNAAVHLNVPITETPITTEQRSTSSEMDVNRPMEDCENDSAQATSSLEATLAARRLTLQRGDAMRNDSTPDDDSNNYKQVDLIRGAPTNPPNKSSTSAIGAIGTDALMPIHQKTTLVPPQAVSTEEQNYSDAATAMKMEKIKWFALRQNSMPVQIDSEVFRVLPKHMRKRIKSAGAEKKRIRLPRD